MMGDEEKPVAVRRQMAASNASHRRAALSATVSNTGWMSVGELADDAQDLAGRGLLLQRLGEVAVACVELREQAHVLDGDHGLIGEGSAAARSDCRRTVRGVTHA